MSYQPDAKSYAYPQQPPQQQAYGGYQAQQPYGQPAYDPLQTQQPPYYAAAAQPAQTYPPAPYQPAPPPAGPTQTDQLVSGFMQGILFVAGFVLSSFGPLVFCAACLLKGRAGFSFFLGAAIAMVILAISVAAFAFAFPIVDSACDTGNYTGLTADQIRAIADQCSYIVSVFKYATIASAVIYGISAIIAFIVAFVSLRNSKRKSSNNY